jgi:DNA repair protein RadC
MIPKYELPREKIIRSGIESLSDLELLVVILGYGTKNNDVFVMAQNLLSNVGGVSGLRLARLGELQAVKGMKLAKATKTLASIELARRINSRPTSDSVFIKKPSDSYSFLMEQLENDLQEQFFLIMLNTKHKVVSSVRLFVGSLYLHLIHPRDIFREAVKNNAKFLILAHNHPSGDTTPSQQDLETTKSIVELGMMMGIKVLDHLIISKEGYRSLKEENYF